jgi:hypothetical protein
MSRLAKDYWARMSPEERRAEIARRRALTKSPWAGVSGPERSRTMRRIMKDYWARMSPEERQAEGARRRALRGKKEPI